MKRRNFIMALGGAAAVVAAVNGALAVRVRHADGRAAALLSSILQLKAESVAARIEQFVKEIESQIGWTTQLPWSADRMELRRFDAVRLLRQVPAISEFALLDPSGHEQLRVSRLAMEVVGSNLDLSADPRFTEAVAHKVYYGPVYLRRESEAYMTLSLAGTRRETGVSVAEIGIKLVWDVVSQLKVGEHGVAYIVDREGRLIAHPDISLVLRNLSTPESVQKLQTALHPKAKATDMSQLAQVQAARAAGSGPTQVQAARDINGRDVLSASASVYGPGWQVFVVLPLAEADTAVP